MMKSIMLSSKEYTFDIKKERAQIKYALGMSPDVDPHLMEERHWALEDEWVSTRYRVHNPHRWEELKKLLVL